MTTITSNAVGNTLTGQTGAGAFAGSDSPVFTTTINTPQVEFSGNNGLIDQNGNEILSLNPAGSAVNYVQVTNAATGFGSAIGAVGSDTDVRLILASQGAGVVDIVGGSIAHPIMSFSQTASGVNFLETHSAATGNPPLIKAAGSDTNINISANGKGTGSLNINGAYTLPATDGSASYVMATDGSGNVSWTPGGSGNWTLIATATASNSASLDFTSISASSYIAHVLVAENLVSAVANQAINIQCSVATVFQTGNYYNAAINRNTAFSTGTGGYNASIAYNPMSGVGMQGASPYGFSMVCYIYGAADTNNIKNFNSMCAGLVYNAAYYVNCSGGGQFSQTAAVDGFRVQMTSGNITSGKVKLYGLS